MQSPPTPPVAPVTPSKPVVTPSKPEVTPSTPVVTPSNPVVPPAVLPSAPLLSDLANAQVSLRQAQLLLVEDDLSGIHQRLGEVKNGEKGKCVGSQCEFSPKISQHFQLVRVKLLALNKTYIAYKWALMLL